MNLVLPIEDTALASNFESTPVYWTVDESDVVSKIGLRVITIMFEQLVKAREFTYFQGIVLSRQHPWTASSIFPCESRANWDRQTWIPFPCPIFEGQSKNSWAVKTRALIAKFDVGDRNIIGLIKCSVSLLSGLSIVSLKYLKYRTIKEALEASYQFSDYKKLPPMCTGICTVYATVNRLEDSWQIERKDTVIHDAGQGALLCCRERSTYCLGAL